MVEEVLKLVGQYGLPLVLLAVLAIAYDRKEKQHQADRAKCEEERRDLLAAFQEERERFWVASKADADNMSKTLVAMHREAASIVNGANDARAAFEQEKKDMKDARERDLRDTIQQERARQAESGPIRPLPRLPRGGGGGGE